MNAEMGLEEAASRAMEILVEQPSGPLGFRFVFQPLMATFVAVPDGFRDARSGAPPYFMTILLPSDRRRPALEEGAKTTAKIIVIAFLLDVAYQVIVLRISHPGGALVIALVLGLLRYTLIRGPASRIVKWRERERNEGGEGENDPAE